MASDNNQDNTNGKENRSSAAGVNLPNDVSSELSQLAALLSQDETNSAEPDIEELLHRMETADNMACGLESRLDGMIGNLDALLKLLESGEDATLASSDAKSNPDNRTQNPGGAK